MLKILMDYVCNFFNIHHILIIFGWCCCCFCCWVPFCLKQLYVAMKSICIHKPPGILLLLFFSLHSSPQFNKNIFQDVFSPNNWKWKQKRTKNWMINNTLRLEFSVSYFLFLLQRLKNKSTSTWFSHFRWIFTIFFFLLLFSLCILPLMFNFFELYKTSEVSTDEILKTSSNSHYVEICQLPLLWF